MNTPSTAQLLLCHTPVTPADAARLVLEMAEEAGLDPATLPREELLRRLRRLIRAGARTLAQEDKTIPLAEAVRHSLEARRDRRPTTLRDLQHFSRRILRVAGAGERPLRSFTPADCRALLQQAFGSSAHSYRKGRAILHSIFAYGLRQEWCDRNPVAAVEVPRITESPIAPLSGAEIARLTAAAAHPEHREMRLSLHLMLYCGIRPAEVQRLDPARDIDRRNRCVLVRPHASKTGGGRVIPLRHAEALRAEDFRIPEHWEKRWRALRRAAGFRRWRPDVCRHTFASYHACHFRDPAALQLEMGHRDARLLWSRYVMATLGDTAHRFWTRQPQSLTTRPRRRSPEAAGAADIHP